MHCEPSVARNQGQVDSLLEIGKVRIGEVNPTMPTCVCHCRVHQLCKRHVVEIDRVGTASHVDHWQAILTDPGPRILRLLSITSTGLGGRCHPPADRCHPPWTIKCERGKVLTTAMLQASNVRSKYVFFSQAERGCCF
jgi:hypothetical protein